MKNFLSEFRDFAMKGNVIDLAVGVIIGVAFNAIVSSLVNDIIMPLLGIIIGRINVASLKVVIPGLLRSPNITLSYGVFLQAIISFLVIAFSLFLTIKLLNSVRKKQDAAPPSLSKSEALLTEIRDLLSKKEQ